MLVDMLEPDNEQTGEVPRIPLGGTGKMLSMENQRCKQDSRRRFAADGCRIVSGSDDRSAAVWDVNKGTKLGA